MKLAIYILLLEFAVDVKNNGFIINMTNEKTIKHKCVTCSVSMGKLSDDYKGEEICKVCEEDSYEQVVQIITTEERIREWYRHWNGKVYATFSGGKDSTVLLDLMRSECPDIPALFVDTEADEMQYVAKERGVGD